MSKKIIVLDPGHGLKPTGDYSRPLIDCTGDKARIVPNSMFPHENDCKPGFYREDFGTLFIARRVAAELECMGHTVYLTRKDNKNAYTYLSEKSTNKWKRLYWKSWKWIKEFTASKDADVFVSIHTNAAGGTGCSAFWANPTNGKVLCENLTNSIHKEFGLKIRRIAKHRYLILRDTCKGNACLLECLFHDNINDIKILLTNKGINRMAKAIAKGIDKHCQSL